MANSGWEWRPRFDSYNLDGVVYRHGDCGHDGKYAALNNAMDNFNSYVQGHTHSLAGVNYYRNEGGKVFGMNVGCGVDHKQLALYYVDDTMLNLFLAVVLYLMVSMHGNHTMALRITLEKWFKNNSRSYRHRDVKFGGYNKGKWEPTNMNNTGKGSAPQIKYIF